MFFRKRRIDLGRETYEDLNYFSDSQKKRLGRARIADLRLERYLGEARFLIEYRNKTRFLNESQKPKIHYAVNTADRDFARVFFMTRDIATGKIIEERWLWQKLTECYASTTILDFTN